MRSIKETMLALLIAASLYACAPALSVSTDFDSATDFSKYKTFAFYELKEKSGYISDLNKDRIVSAVKNEFEKKGLTESRTNPDLYINVVTMLKERKDVSRTTDYYGYGGFYRPYMWGTPPMFSTSQYNVDYYQEGTLFIDLIDASTNKLVWQGIGNGRVDQPVKNPDRKIPEAVAKIVEPFPGTAQ